MKNNFSIPVLAISLLIGACNSSATKNEQAATVASPKTAVSDTTQVYNLDTTKLKSGQSFYQCEMHPEVLSNKPGTCPKCEMALTEIKKQ
jgi:hypothetical protein